MRPAARDTQVFHESFAGDCVREVWAAATCCARTAPTVQRAAETRTAAKAVVTRAARSGRPSFLASHAWTGSSSTAQNDGEEQTRKEGFSDPPGERQEGRRYQRQEDQLRPPLHCFKFRPDHCRRRCFAVHRLNARTPPEHPSEQKTVSSTSGQS